MSKINTNTVRLYNDIISFIENCELPAINIELVIEKIHREIHDIVEKEVERESKEEASQNASSPLDIMNGEPMMTPSEETNENSEENQGVA